VILRDRIYSALPGVLNTSMMSPRNRLYFKVGSFKCINLSLYGIFLKFITSLIALFGFFQAL